MASGRQASSLWQKYLQTPRCPSSLRGHRFAPVNHPALVKTNDQPSFSSANSSPFTFAEVLRSDISLVLSLNLKPNPRGGTAKKIKNSPYKKIVEAAQKRKIKQTTKSKTNRLVSNVFLGPSKKTEEEGLLWSISVWQSTRIGQWTGCSSRWRCDWRGWRTRCRLFVRYWSFLWRQQWRRLDTTCQMFQMGAHCLGWYGGRFCWCAFSGISTVLFLVCIFLFEFLKFSIYSLCFLRKLFTSPN